MQENGEGVLEAGGVDGASGADEAGYALGETQKVNGLVEQVGAQVEDG